MKQVLCEKLSIIERAYDSQEECDNDVTWMKEIGFNVIADTDDIYEYFRRYIKKEIL